MTGSMLSHYRITEELGRGGMGIVYKATDTKLNRTVALKVLPTVALSSDDDRARFYREAQAAAQLHHPNIATVFEIDEAVPVGEDGSELGGGDGARLFIAMEFIDGESLQAYVGRGPMKLSEAVNVAAQVAEALKTAHAAEIVHRDVKSANVMLTKEGVAKVLDFGLAKTNQSTMLTRLGSTLGTVAYMSPEQARGQEVDQRTDLYSLGTMLYEMVAGRLPFSGEYEQAVVYGILNEPPEPLTALRTGVPMQLEWIVNKLLAKDAEYRYQTAADLLADLKSLDLSGSGHSRRSMPAMSAVSAPVASKRGSPPVWMLGAIGAALLLGAAGSWLVKPSAPPDAPGNVRELVLQLAPGTLYDLDFPRVSPDGRFLAVDADDSLGTPGLRLIDVATGDFRTVLNARGLDVHFSPDGNRLIYSDAEVVFVINRSGGSPTRIPDASPWAATWISDGRILYADRETGGLYVLPETGGEAIEVLPRDTTITQFGGLIAMPNGRHVIYHARERAGSFLHVLDLKNGSTRRLGPGAFASFVPPGHLIYQAGENLWRGPLMARPFDTKRMEFAGREIVIAQDAARWRYGVGADGTLYHHPFDQGDGADRVYLYSINDGQITKKSTIEADAEDFRISSDGRRISYSVDAQEGGDWIEVMDLTTNVRQRITFSGDGDYAAWSRSAPDDLLIERDNKAEIWSASGLGLKETLPIQLTSDLDWSADGRWVAYKATRAAFGPLRLFDRETGSDTLLIARAQDPRFSPDGRYIAFTEQTDLGTEAAVVASSGQGYRRLALNGQMSRGPVWSPDAKYIFVDELGNRGLRVPIDISGSIEQVGPAELVFDADSRIYTDVAPDGTWYVMSDDEDLVETFETDARTGGSLLHVVVNFDDRLRELAPPTR